MEDYNQETHEEGKSRHPKENGETTRGEERQRSEREPVERTPSGLADGGVTPANIEAGTGELLNRKSRSEHQRSQEVYKPAALSSTHRSSAQHTAGRHRDSGKKLSDGQGNVERTEPASAGSARQAALRMTDSQKAAQNDPGLQGQDAGRPQRTLVPIQAARGAQVAPDSATLEDGVWESASRGTAGSRGKRGSAGYKAQEGANRPAANDKLSAQKYGETQTGLRESSKPNKFGTLDAHEEAKSQFHAQIAASGGLKLETESSNKVLAATLGRSQAQQVSITGSRTGSGAGRPGEPRGLRAFNYNEDDLNHSYVERVLAMGQPHAPTSRKEQLPHLRTSNPSTNGNTKDASGGGLSARVPVGGGHFGARHQSVDVAGRDRSRQLEGAKPFVQHRPSQDPSQLSGLTLGAHSPLIEEVRKNNFMKVAKIMEQFMVDKHNSGTVTGAAAQQRNRSIKNTFQTAEAQRLRAGGGRGATRLAEKIDYPGVIGPKQEVKVPRELVLFQLSKNVDASTIENSISNSARQAAGALSSNQPGNSIADTQQQNTRADRSFLDFLEGSVPGPDGKPQGLANAKGGRNNQFHSVAHQAAVPGEPGTLNTMDAKPASKFEAPQGATQLGRGDGSNALLDHSQPSMVQSLDMSPSLPSFAHQGPDLGVSPSPAFSNFHITDLLERSLIVGTKQREQSKLRQVIELYKRSVKGDKELGSRKEVMIRNYRLRVLKDAARELTPETRALLLLNKGTTIHVSNSIIRPEKHQFGTEVSDRLAHVYPFLLEDATTLLAKPSRGAGKGTFHGRSQSVQPQGVGSAAFAGTHPNPAAAQEMARLVNEEARLVQQEFDSRREEAQELGVLMEEQASEASQRHGVVASRGSQGSRQRMIDQDQEELPNDVQYPQGSQIDDGLSSRPFTAADATELAAVEEANKIFDRWLRNIMSQASAALATPRRQKLRNGQLAAPGLPDINWHIAVNSGGILKEKPIAPELLTQRSFYDNTPYRHLQMLVVNQDIREWYSRFVLKTQCVKTYSEIVNHELSSLKFADCKIAIDFSRHHLTHLDPVVFRDDNLPLELFLDYDRWIQSFAREVRDLKAKYELTDEQDRPGIPAYTDYLLGDGSRRPIKVQVHDYDPLQARFLVRNDDFGVVAWRSRLFIRREDDKREDLDAHKKVAMQRKAEALHFLRLQRLINDEMTKRYSYLRLSNEVLKKIQDRIHVDLFKYNPDSVRKIILQIEALYVFAILKSALTSQRNDPFVKGLLLKYKVPLDSAALSYFQPQHKEKSHLEGIQGYNMKGVKVELDHNSLLLMDEKYIKLPQFLNSVTLRTIGAHKLYRYPFDINLLLAQNSKELKKISREELEAQVNSFPLHHDKFVLAQKLMSQYFHQIAKFRWAEAIQKEIWGFVKDDFNFDQGKELREDEIDPVLLRLFYQLKLYMQTVIFDHFESALRDYMRFLLSFILRDPEMRESKIIEDVKYNPWIRLSLKENLKMQFKKGEIVNDIDLIPMHSKPMIVIASQIDDLDIPGKIIKKQKVVTRPELDTVHKDLFSIILNMHAAFQEIDRVDGIVFPLLKLDDPYLMVPDVKNNEKLSHYVRIIEKLIDQCLKSTKKELQNINSYMYIFDKRVDNIILDLKKRSFTVTQDLSDGGRGAEKDDARSREADATTVAAAEKEEAEESGEEDDDSYGDDGEEEDEGEDGYQGNDMAYKSVEIDDGLMKEELFFLRDLIWKVLENIHNQYDFGMVYFDCVKFKDRTLAHVRDLIDHLENHIRSDFTNKQKAIQAEIVGVTGQLDMEAESIDDVIFLLDYIDSLKKQDNKIGDISLMIDDLAKRMDYIDGVEIRFPDAQYSEFLEIRNWPRTFKQYIEARKQALLAQKDELYKEMSKEIEAVLSKIKGFQDTIAEVLIQGLLEQEQSYDAEDDESLDSMASGDKKAAPTAEEEEAKRAETQRLLESADGKTFPWLAKEVEMEHMKFDIDQIEKQYGKIEQLKQHYDDVERATALINKRETLLGEPKTAFSELRRIQDDLKPLYELWLVASKFCRTLPQWVEGQFDQLDAGQIETNVDEWINELKRLQKTNLVIDNPKQQELQKFMFDSLNHFKRYGPMLRTLRTKGLVGRHWRMIGTKLEFVIDPANITLYRLIVLELYDEEKLKTIKQICEIATKEYALQLALETLDQEMRAVEFELQVQSDGETVVVTKLPELISMFEEFFLRVSVLKTNPHIRNFYEKLLEIEKIIKNVVELINEWAVFQRNFIYLNGIFVLEEISKQLVVQAKSFLQVQALYNATTQSFQAAPQVYRINSRENFLTILIKNTQECEHIRGGLVDFLERKRGKFPRLFFLSNEELIDIFGKGPQLVETIMDGGSSAFITNLFEGIDAVRFHEVTQEITEMLSKEGEEVHLAKEVMTRNTTGPDSWLKMLESSMVLTVKDAVFLTFEQMGLQEVEHWISSWPGQATFLASQMWFTMKVHSIFLGAADRDKARRYAGANTEDEENSEEEEQKGADDKLTTATPVPKPEGELEENAEAEIEEVDEERAYLEEVDRQIAKDEANAPEKAQLEKILRLKRRFRINKEKAPGEQMSDMYRDIADIVLQLTGMVRKKLKKHVRQSTVALLTGYVHYRDILKGLMQDKVYKVDEFKWQMQFKFEMKNAEDVVYKSAFDTGGRRKLETNKLEVDCEVFGNARSYGFEYLGNCQRLVVTPLTERCQRSLLVALQYQYGGAPEGPFGTGKTETTKDLSRHVAKLCFVMNCSANYEYAGVCRFFKGLASSGAWVCFDEFNRLETQILSMLSQVIISIQGAIRNQAAHLQLDEAKIPLKQDCAIFITLNPGYAGRSELPMNLKTLFRSISMVVPDAVFITEILLYSSGFVGAQQLAKKIVSVQNLANVIMKNTEIAHDFGLRSIKAIVSIAENLKLQAQNIVDSELAEIIDDDSLSQVAYKADQVVKEIMTVSQAAIAKATATSKNAGATVDGAGKSGQGSLKAQNGTFHAGADELVKINEATENGLDSGASPLLTGERLGGTNKDINKRSGLKPIDEQVQSRERGGFRESTQSMPAGDNEAQEGKEGGELYDRLWGKTKFTERQLQTVYRQIGIDPEQHYEEEELEEYIILKAVRDFNHSKFATEEHIIIEGIIKDIFQGSVPDLDKPIQDYGNLKEALHQSFEASQLDFSKNLTIKALQFYEIQRSKHGCILVGEPQSGKSTLIHLLQSALNKAAMNEYMLTVSEKRRDRLIELAKEYEREVVETSLQKTQTIAKSGLAPTDMIGGTVKKKNKKNDKDAQAKKLLQQWQDMYRRTKLTEEELDEVRAALKIKGVSMRRINPKGLSMEELFGTFDKESHEWQEGLFTQQYRDYANSKDDKKKWILLDGPIDFMWVENLNSILDDNKKMSLPNGESIKMSEGMCILLETNHMANVTPATVSRCGLIYLHRQETCDPKAIFNQWLRRLPPNLTEYVKDLECATNFLMVEAVAVFEEEKKAAKVSFAGVDLHWLMQNFTRLLTTFIFDFYLEYEKSTAQSAATQNPNELGKSLQNMTLNNGWVDTVPDPNMTAYAASEVPASAQGQSRQGSRHSQQRVKTPDAHERELDKRKRLPVCNFIDKEARFENALKFTPIWLESFVIFAMVWTFYPVLSDEGRKQLDQRLQAKYATARTEFSVYQKEKKRKMAEKNRDKSQGNKQSIDRNKSVGRASAILSKRTPSEKSASMALPSKERDSQANNDGFTAFWTDELEEKPMLVSDYPEGVSFFDCWFNLETSGWTPFSLEQAANEAQIDYTNRMSSQKKLQHFYVPSHDSVRYSYLLECLITKQVSTIVVGPACSGRSALLRDMLFTQVFAFTKQLVADHVTMSAQCDSKVFKDSVEGLLEWRLNKKTGQRKLRPHLDNKLVCYVEDLHMSWTDAYGDQPAIEAIRDYLTSQAWFSSRKKRWRELEDVSFFACMASNAPETAKVSGRVLHQFNLISLDEPKTKTMRSMFSSLTELMVINWPSAIQMYSSNIVAALIDISLKVFERLKPTPMKAHYTFNWRDARKVLLSMQMIEANSLKKQANVMKLLYHECYRNFGDRLLMVHDRKWFTETLKEVCSQHFYVVEQLEVFGSSESPAKASKGGQPTVDEKGGKGAASEAADELDPKRKDQFLWPILDPDQLFFSKWNQEVEGFYMEVDRVDEIDKVIEANLERYNDSNERVRLDLILFNQLNRLMLKILRVISMPSGHLINVAMKGFGMNSVIKLVAFAAAHHLREFEVFEGFQHDEWHAELRRAVLYCASEGKPLTFFVDEYKMIRDQMYTDLECLLKNHVASEITKKSDVMMTLLELFQQIEAEKAASKVGLAGDDAKNQVGEVKAEEQEEEDGHEEEQQQEAITDGKKMLQRWPHIEAELYQVFLNRVKDNFHLVLQYSPTGRSFRQKIAKHKELMYLSQMIFMSDLPAPELEALGRGFFKLEHEKAVNKAIVDGAGAPKLNQYSVTNDKDSQDRVLRCIGKMYLQALEMTKTYAEDQNQILYMTPTMFLRVFNCYKKLLKERQVVVKEISARYEAGLDKIRQTQDAIYSYHQELEKKSPVLQEKHESLVRVINEIEEEFGMIKGQRDQLKRDEFEADEQTGQALRIKEQCEETLNKIMPSLNEAENSVTKSDFSKHDIAELRSMQKPPKIVKLVLQTVCMLLGVPPAEKKSKKTGKLKLSYWKAAQGQEVLGNPRLPEVLVEFDRNKVTPEVMMEVEDVLTNGQYSYERAHTASVAATGIFKWVKATRDYFYIFKEIEPRRDAFMLSQKQYEEKKNQLQEKTEKIVHLDSALQGLKEHQKSKDEIIEDLRAEIQDCSIRKKRADILLKGLSAEKQKWIVCTRMLASKYTTVTGDVLLSAGYITLIGGFSQRFRSRLLQRWAKALTEEGFQCSKEFIFTELFGDSYSIRKWHENELPHDNVSVNNALVVEKTKRFSLLIDPQTQGITWLKKQFDAAGTLTVTKQNDSQFKKLVEIAIDMGRTVIVEHVEEHIGSNLQSLMKMQVSKYGGQRMIQFCRKSYKYDPNFKLFVVSSHPRPHFDVHITNHVTLLNFSVNVESLQAQLLGLVVLNERKDLEDTYSENSKEAFDSIKSLKDIEKAILSQLEMRVSELLGDENLINTLNESKNTAEYVAARLRNIGQTSQFIQKARDTYAPVAYRAAILYFVVQDLQKVNNMYQFSLSWFKKIFTKSLEMTNVVREEPRGADDSDMDDGQTEGSSKPRGSAFSVEERIDLLVKTFTQELFKRIQMAIFEDDRNVVTYMLVTRVMQAENFIDQGLFDFLMCGAQSVPAGTQVPRDISNLPWLNSMMWADLQYLAGVKPFNSSNLLAHIIQNQEKWEKFHGRRDKALSFQDLPNRDQLDLRFFSQLDDGELDAEVGRLLPGSPSARGNQSQQQLRGTDVASMAARTAGDTNSRAGSRGTMKRTESAILNDPNIWNVSDSDDEFREGAQTSEKQSYDDAQSKQNEEGAGREDNSDGEEQDMAKYLVEQAPSLGGRNNDSNINSLWRKTVSERTLILKREKAVKGLCELCVLRCIRPDHLLESMDRFVLNVLDPNYFDFNEDLLGKMQAEKNRNSTHKDLQKNASSAVELAKKALGQSKTNISRMSNTNESQSAANPSALQQNVTAGSRMHADGASGQMNETKQSGMMSGTQQTNASAKRAAQEEQERQAREARDKRVGLNDIKSLINAAYEDSDARAPVFFLVAHSVNVLDILTEFHHRKLSASSSLKLQHFSLGKGLEELVEEKMAKAAQNGDWILLENLHLVENWLPVFEEKLSKWKGAELNARFRVWITCVPVDNFPANILERSIKVALQAPATIKAKVERMLLEQEKEYFFRKSNKQANYHKNLFFGLAYFHSILEGRKRYGTLGWNLPYKFDYSDFEVSNAQLASVMKQSSPDPIVQMAGLDMLKYHYAHINYAGRVQRTEDQVTLNAILDDLFNSTITFAPETPANQNASHYGFPAETSDFLAFCERSIPVRDPYTIFGFDWNVESSLQAKEIFGVLDKIHDLNLTKPGETEARGGAHTSIEMNSLKTSLRSSDRDSGLQIDKALKDQGSLLSLFVALQNLLGGSSLDGSATLGGKRYDHFTDQEILPKRDLHDAKVAEVARVLLIAIDAQFRTAVIEEKFPIRYKAPLNNVINRELTSFKRLLTVIRASVEDLLATIGGVYPRPFEIEALWSRIQQNRVPAKWLEVSFQTARESLADYLVELGRKLEFWKTIVEAEGKELPSYWLPAFYDPRSFLGALIQTKARDEGIPMHDLRNDFEVMQTERNEAPSTEKHVHYIHGLSLDGAKWDAKRKLLVDSTTTARFAAFPAIRVSTVRTAESLAAIELLEEQTANFNANATRKKGKKKHEGEANLQAAKKYKCPVYISTLRLSAGPIAKDNAPVAHLELPILESASKWIKRSVALILETQ